MSLPNSPLSSFDLLNLSEPKGENAPFDSQHHKQLPFPQLPNHFHQSASHFPLPGPPGSVDMLPPRNPQFHVHNQYHPLHGLQRAQDSQGDKEKPDNPGNIFMPQSSPNSASTSAVSTGIGNSTGVQPSRQSFTSGGTLYGNHMSVLAQQPQKEQYQSHPFGNLSPQFGSENPTLSNSNSNPSSNSVTNSMGARSNIGGMGQIHGHNQPHSHQVHGQSVNNLTNHNMHVQGQNQVQGSSVGVGLGLGQTHGHGNTEVGGVGVSGAVGPNVGGGGNLTDRLPRQTSGSNMISQLPGHMLQQQELQHLQHHSHHHHHQHQHQHQHQHHHHHMSNPASPENSVSRPVTRSLAARNEKRARTQSHENPSKRVKFDDEEVSDTDEGEESEVSNDSILKRFNSSNDKSAKKLQPQGGKHTVVRKQEAKGSGPTASTETEQDQLQQKADERNSEARFQLGWKYGNGDGCEKDIKKAIRYYMMAAVQGHSRAQYTLGWIYEHGDEYGIEKDFDIAQEWYLRAAASKAKDAIYSNREAQYRLGLLHDPDIERESLVNMSSIQRSYSKAYDWYLKAAKGGLEDAEYNVALLLGEGKSGVPTDRQKAIRFYKSAAEKGHIPSMYQLGVIYDEDKRYEEAIEHYKRALDACKKTSGHDDIKRLSQESLDELQTEMENIKKRAHHIQNQVQKTTQSQNSGSTQPPTGGQQRPSQPQTRQPPQQPSQTQHQQSQSQLQSQQSQQPSQTPGLPQQPQTKSGLLSYSLPTQAQPHLPTKSSGDSTGATTTTTQVPTSMVPPPLAESLQRKLQQFQQLQPLEPNVYSYQKHYSTYPNPKEVSKPASNLQAQQDKKGDVQGSADTGSTQSL